MRLSNVLPALAIELEQLLKNQGEAELAAQVVQLTIVDRCRCGDDFCSSFYTLPKPEDATALATVAWTWTQQKECCSLT